MNVDAWKKAAAERKAAQPAAKEENALPGDSHGPVEEVPVTNGTWMRAYLSVASAFGKIDQDVVDANVKAVTATPDNERAIPLSVATFLAVHLPTIIGMTVLNEGQFRDMLVINQDLEKKMDAMGEGGRARERQLTQKVKAPTEGHAIEMGVSMYTFGTMSALYDHMAAGFSALRGTEFAKKVNAATESADDAEKAAVGMVLCNFVYTIRALCNNYEFWNSFTARVLDAEKKYGCLLS